MPSIGEFNVKFAEIIGAPLGSVIKVQRTLRDARLFTTGARGVNAPDALPLDAARMLEAFLVTDRPSLAVAAVLEFGQLGVSILNRFDTAGDPVREDFLHHTCGVQTLEEGLVAIIQAFAALTVDERISHSGAAYVECATNDLSATLSWPGGLCLFSNKGSWHETLALEEGPDRDARLNQIAMIESRDKSAGRKYFDSAGQVLTRRRVSGETLAELAGLFCQETPSVKG